jgi:Ca-activated chloride channel family protein
MPRQHETAVGPASLCGFLLSCLVAAPHLGTRRGQVPTPLFHETSSLVVLNATVIDKAGHVVPGLPRDRFAVYDDGRRQPITFFNNVDVPVTVGLVIDTSLSMQPKMNELVAAAVVFARASNPQDELFVTYFNDRVHDMLSGRGFLASDSSALESAIEALVPEGRTALYDALLAGMDRLDRGSRMRKALVLISDGGDNASHATLATVLARARRSNAAIYTVGVFDRDDIDRDPGLLAKLARMTGGATFLPASPGLLVQTCQQIAHDIRSSYTIGYPTPESHHEYHQVRVAIVNPPDSRLTVRTRTGYVASEPAR